MKNLSSVIDELEEEMMDMAAEFGGALVADLNKANPLKTGLSRSNWFVSLTPQPNIKHAVRAPQDTINQAKAVLSGGNIKSTYYIQNNIEYIVPLLMGTSPQARKGWMDRAIFANINKIYGND